MVGLQILSKILNTKSMDIVTNNQLSAEHFGEYQKEYEFIAEHQREYGNVPDIETFLATFETFDIVDVTESDHYLVDTINEEYLYYKSVEVVQEVATLLKTDSNAAVEYLRSRLDDLRPTTSVKGQNIIQGAESRLEAYGSRLNGDRQWTIATGFDELDDVINGWTRGEEFAVIVARTGEGKSFVLTKTLAHAWSMGFRVGMISPEMSPDKIGFRFDTMIKNFSNKNLVWGREEEGYVEYIEELVDRPTPFIVATPMDFRKKVTVSKLRAFCETNKLDILGIDGITYLSDERYKKGDNKTISLTNISEDLMGLSLELGIPIITVVQSNRGGVKDGGDGTPDLQDIRDSDGIAHNATTVISLRQTGAGLEMGIKKNREGVTGGKLVYFWDIDKGIFKYVPTNDDSAMADYRSDKVKELKKGYGDASSVF